MDEQTEAPIDFSRTGGFAPFPFFPALFEIGEFRIVWKDWILFEQFEVRYCGALFLRTGPSASIVSLGQVEGYFKKQPSQGPEGVRLKAVFGEDEFFTECKVAGGDSGKARLDFIAYGNHKEIGSFSWVQGNEDFITGVIQREKRNESWFWGMSLMKLWRIEKGRKSGA